MKLLKMTFIEDKSTESLAFCDALAAKTIEVAMMCFPCAVCVCVCA
jgi:hypothetical protein